MLLFAFSSTRLSRRKFPVEQQNNNSLVKCLSVYCKNLAVPGLFVPSDPASLCFPALPKLLSFELSPMSMRYGCLDPGDAPTGKLSSALVRPSLSLSMDATLASVTIPNTVSRARSTSNRTQSHAIAARSL